VTWASAPKIRSERIFILLHPLTVHVRISQAANDLPARRRSIFYLLDAYALLREQFFRLGFLLSDRLLERFPASQVNGASGGISRAEPGSKGAGECRGLCLQVVHASK
jgi:hypothetical protein